MSRLFTASRVLLSMVAAARLGTPRTRRGAAPGGAADASEAANRRIIATAPNTFRVRISWALPSRSMSEAQLGAESHHARDAVEQRAPFGELIPLDGAILAVLGRVGRDERLPAGRVEPVRGHRGAGGRVDRVDVVPVEDVQRPDVEIQALAADSDRLVQLGVDLE